MRALIILSFLSRDLKTVMWENFPEGIASAKTLL